MAGKFPNHSLEGKVEGLDFYLGSCLICKQDLVLNMAALISFPWYMYVYSKVQIFWKKCQRYLTYYHKGPNTDWQHSNNLILKSRVEFLAKGNLTV